MCLDMCATQRRILQNTHEGRNRLGALSGSPCPRILSRSFITPYWDQCVSVGSSHARALFALRPEPRLPKYGAYCLYRAQDSAKTVQRQNMTKSKYCLYRAQDSASPLAAAYRDACRRLSALLSALPRPSSALGAMQLRMPGGPTRCSGVIRTPRTQHSDTPYRERRNR